MKIKLIYLQNRLKLFLGQEIDYRKREQKNRVYNFEKCDFFVIKYFKYHVAPSIRMEI